MKKIASFCLSFALVLLLCLLSFAEQKAIIQKLSGKVEVFSMGKWRIAKVGDIISSGQKIKTSKTGYCIILLQDGHTVRISGGSETSVTSLVSEKTEFQLTLGRIRSKVAKLISGGSFNVRTPTAVCSVRGTDFAVEYDNQMTKVEVYEGKVAALQEATGQEIEIPAGSYSEILPNQPPSEPQNIPPENIRPFEETIVPKPEEEVKVEALNEMMNEISREAVLSRAEEEIKLAEYQNGKALIDVNGNRVRLEEYIVRPAPNMFKYVVLNTRADTFNFGKMWFVFNKDLPKDLTLATKNMFYYEGSTKPEWILNTVGSVMSNTIDQINELALDGDMVPDNPAEPTHWKLFFKEYHFAVNKQVWWEYKDSNGNNELDLSEIKFYDLTQKTKISYPDDRYDISVWMGNEIPSTNFSQTLTMPSGPDAFHFRLKDTYGENQWIQSDEYIINDDGKIYTVGDLTGLTKEQLNEKAYQANFERIYTASVFEGRKIDLVFSAKLLIDSGILSLPNPKNVTQGLSVE